MSKGTRYPHTEYYLARYSNPSSRVLEIGCGAALYRDMFPAGQYFGLDVPNPHYQDWDSVDLYGRAENLPFSNKYFDLIFSQATIDYVEGIQQMLLESRRVLRENGKILVFTYKKETLQRIHDSAINPIYSSHTHFHVYDESDMIRFLKQAGFQAKKIPHVFRPHNKISSYLSKLPVIRHLADQRVSWRTFLAWK